MPAVAIATPSVTFALRYDFGSWSLKHREISEWIISVQRHSPYLGPLFGLFDVAEDSPPISCSVRTVKIKRDFRACCAMNGMSRR